MFPTRDPLIGHVEHHAAGGGLELRRGTTVEQIVRDDGGWRVRTSNGELRAGQVIVATGYGNEPVIPDWPGRHAHPGQLLHSSQYRNPQPCRGDRVLVVGPGSSGMEIAHDPRPARRPSLAGGAHAAQHPPSRGPRRHARRHDRRGDAPSPHTGRRCARVLRAPDEHQRSQRIRATGPRSRADHPAAPSRRRARDRRYRANPDDQDRRDRDPSRGPGVRRPCGAPRRRIHDRARRGHLRHRLSPRLERLVGGADVLDEHGRPRATGEHPAAPFASSATSPGPQGSATWPSRPNAPPRQSPQNSATRVGALESPSSVVETYAGHGAGLNGRRLTSGCRPRHKADTTSPWSLPVQQVPSHRRRARRSRPCRCSRGRSSGGLLPDCRGGS